MNDVGRLSSLNLLSINGALAPRGASGRIKGLELGDSCRAVEFEGVACSADFSATMLSLGVDPEVSASTGSASVSPLSLLLAGSDVKSLRPVACKSTKT